MNIVGGGELGGITPRACQNPTTSRQQPLKAAQSYVFVAGGMYNMLF